MGFFKQLINIKNNKKNYKKKISLSKIFFENLISSQTMKYKKSSIMELRIL